MRLTIDRPLAGVVHNLQDKNGKPIDPKRAVDGPLSFDFTIRVAEGPKFYGEQVRSEGPERRFVYVAIGTSAGDHGSPRTRRMKVDIHTIPQPLIDAAVAGKILEGTVRGTGKDGTPACATVPVSWRAV
ncbi:DUF5990 family protein [Sphingomonas sp. LB-2]|nr:DUF5990 family protein [Sphingomonas caeni]